MRYQKFFFALAVLLAIAFSFSTSSALAQAANPTASRALQLSAFGGATGVLTGLDRGKNLSITAGGDLGLPPWHGLRPSIEVRGTYPIDDGQVDSQRSILGGLRVEFLLNHRIHPYGDFLFGRGQMNYESSRNCAGYCFDGLDYALTTTYIDAGGGGFDYDLNRHLAVKVDAQVQRWGGPAPTPSGIVYSTAGTIGLVYTFTFDHHYR
jgi:hypothetical protein